MKACDDDRWNIEDSNGGRQVSSPSRRVKENVIIFGLELAAGVIVMLFSVANAEERRIDVLAVTVTCEGGGMDEIE